MNDYFDVNCVVDKSTLYRSGLITDVIKGINYVRFIFNFKDGWENKHKIAVFLHNGEENAVLIKDNSCVLPIELSNVDTIELYLVGINGSQRINTNKLYIKQKGV